MAIELRRPAGRLMSCVVLIGAVNSCATGDGGDSSFTFGQVVGVLAATVGTVAGDQNLSQQGMNMYNQSSGGTPAYTPPASTPAPRTTPSPAPRQASATQAPPSSDCITYIQRQRMQAVANMRQCQVSEAELRSIHVDDGSLPQPRRQCHQQLDPRSAQNVSFNNCAVVYKCAYNTYSAALVYAQQGMECQSALQTALRNHPIPGSSR